MLPLVNARVTPKSTFPFGTPVKVMTMLAPLPPTVKSVPFTPLSAVRSASATSASACSTVTVTLCFGLLPAVTDQTSFSCGVPARVRVTVVQLMTSAWVAGPLVEGGAAGVPAMVTLCCGSAPSTDTASVKLPERVSVMLESASAL